jgi:peptidoglycan/LPS O-acetylase OafA/YrhL
MTMEASSPGKSATSAEHIPFLDYLRGIAILSVFLFHCIAPNLVNGELELPWHGLVRDFRVEPWFLALFPFTLGWIGVPIFFVVSGFCIHLSHARSRAKGWDVYVLRRFFRIYPPYLLALLFFALVFPWTKLDFSTAVRHAHSQFLFSVSSLGSHLALLHNFHGGVAWTINPTFWSIAVEVQLYALYPILVFMAGRMGWYRALGVTLAFELVMRAILTIAGHHLHDNAFIGLNPLTYWFSWSIGAALAEAHIQNQPIPFAKPSLLFFPMLMLFCYMLHPLYHFCFTLASLSTAYFMSHWLRHPGKIPFTSARGAIFYNQLRIAGLTSYSLYLIHAPLLALIYNIMSAHVPELPRPALFAICVASYYLILIPGYAMYRYIEQPSIACGKWIIAQRRKAAAKATPFVTAAES